MVFGILCGNRVVRSNVCSVDGKRVLFLLLAQIAIKVECSMEQHVWVCCWSDFKSFHTDARVFGVVASGLNRSISQLSCFLCWRMFFFRHICVTDKSWHIHNNLTHEICNRQSETECALSVRTTTKNTCQHFYDCYHKWVMFIKQEHANNFDSCRICMNVQKKTMYNAMNWNGCSLSLFFSLSSSSILL